MEKLINLNYFINQLKIPSSLYSYTATPKEKPIKN